jgi:hypothetical protein
MADDAFGARINVTKENHFGTNGTLVHSVEGAHQFALHGVTANPKASRGATI